MIAPHHDGRFDFAALYQVVDGHTEAGALAVSQPADARRQSLELDAFARQVYPALENLIVRKHFQHQIVGHGNVRRVAGERHPAKRPAAFAKQRTNVGGHESGKIVSILHAALVRERSNVVAIIKSD